MRLADLLRHLSEFLAVAAVPDVQPNGLQVEGKHEVRRIATGVTACEELFQRAAEAQADAVLTHHGLLWEGQLKVIAGPHRRRLKLLLDHDMSLLSYHLPLDMHPEVGNNAVAARDLGLQGLLPFGSFNGMPVGVMGSLQPAMPRSAFLARLAQYYGQQPLAFLHGRDPLARVGIVSGSGQGSLEEAVAAGLDLLVTGEVREQTLHTAKEFGINFAACGHHATERVGVKALGNHLATKFAVEHRFVDVPNPV